MNKKFSHIDAAGNPTMVDVGAKTASKRVAKARAIVKLSDEILSHLKNDDIHTKKGPVFQIAITAGIMAAKQTGYLIPLCHPLGLENCNVAIKINTQNEVEITSIASLIGKTGVEMEALMAVNIAALTVYDMCKVFSHDIVIKEVRLIEKTGGKSDFKLI